MKKVVHLGRQQRGFVCLEVPYVKLVPDFCQRPGLCFHKLSEPTAWQSDGVKHGLGGLSLVAARKGFQAFPPVPQLFDGIVTRGWCGISEAFACQLQQVIKGDVTALGDATNGLGQDGWNLAKLTEPAYVSEKRLQNLGVENEYVC